MSLIKTNHHLVSMAGVSAGTTSSMAPTGTWCRRWCVTRPFFGLTRRYHLSRPLCGETRHTQDLTPPISYVAEHITRLTPVALPGLSRPGVRLTTRPLVRRQTKWAIRRLGIRPFAVVATYPGDLLSYWGSDVVNVFYGTDDYVAGAELMGISARYQLRQEKKIISQADIVIAVSLDGGRSMGQLWRPSYRNP